MMEWTGSAFCRCRLLIIMPDTERGSLDRRSLKAVVAKLAHRDPVLAELHRCWGDPPLWRRPATFRTLVFIVLEQKISLASARAVMRRIDLICQPFTTARFLALDPAVLRRAGASDAKIGYCRAIAVAMREKHLVLGALTKMSDDEATKSLVDVRGIGPWTAGVYLTMALCRPDAWPSGDRALAVSVAETWGLESVPDYPALDERAEAWRPYRGAATRLLWHAYLSRRKS